MVTWNCFKVVAPFIFDFVIVIINGKQILKEGKTFLNTLECGRSDESYSNLLE